jgi:hypothetical protein
VRISAFMVTTAARAWCIPLAVRCFRRQSGAARLGAELMVVSEDESVESLLPDDSAVRFEHVPRGLSLGEKHNEAVRRCRYGWIAKWDDDDWHAPRRLGLTLRHLHKTGALLAGTRELLFHELFEPRRTFLYQNPSTRPWVAGNALVFHRSVWAQHPFPDRRSGVDTLFAWNALPDTPHVVIDDPGIVVVLQHGQTTGRKTWKPEPPEYQPWPGGVESVMGSDLARYEAAFRATVA